MVAYSSALGFSNWEAYTYHRTQLSPQGSCIGNPPSFFLDRVAGGLLWFLVLCMYVCVSTSLESGLYYGPGRYLNESDMGMHITYIYICHDGC